MIQPTRRCWFGAGIRIAWLKCEISAERIRKVDDVLAGSAGNFQDQAAGTADVDAGRLLCVPGCGPWPVP